MDAIYKQEGFDELCKTGHHLNQCLLENQAATIKELFAVYLPCSIVEARLKIKELRGIERSNLGKSFYEAILVPFFENKMRSLGIGIHDGKNKIG